MRVRVPPRAPHRSRSNSGPLPSLFGSWAISVVVGPSALALNPAGCGPQGALAATQHVTAEERPPGRKLIATIRPTRELNRRLVWLLRFVWVSARGVP